MRLKRKAENKRQKTITDSLKNKTPAEKECVEICTAWVKTLAGANIPLSKTDHPLVREFLDRRVRNGGVISGRTQLTDTHLPEVYLKEKENLKLKRKDKKIAVIFVECCDEARSVLNVPFAPLQPDFSRQVNSFLVDTVFLDAVNHSTVSQAVVKAVNEYQIDYENVVVIDTDNASYMKKAFDSVFSAQFPNSVHITCSAHIVNLIDESFRKPFQMVNTFVRGFKNMFYNSGGRKVRYLHFMNQKLQEESPDVKASMPPSRAVPRHTQHTRLRRAPENLGHHSLRWSWLESSLLRPLPGAGLAGFSLILPPPFSAGQLRAPAPGRPEQHGPPLSRVESLPRPCLPAPLGFWQGPGPGQDRRSETST
ncbi:EF-hand calcium-binding domain-containing protein 11 isoform X1 [Natator depressus]|uniref:EF-hand calcium-binding domain-containing protein 11 isoform X1 n=1 Tax=Natator depressus TaxID=27790 RepID=UPI003EBA532E